MYLPLEFRDVNLFEALALVCVVRNVLKAPTADICQHEGCLSTAWRESAVSTLAVPFERDVRRSARIGDLVPYAV